MEEKRRAGYELLKLAAQKIPYLALHGQTSAPHGTDIRYREYKKALQLDLPHELYVLTNSLTEIA